MEVRLPFAVYLIEIVSVVRDAVAVEHIEVVVPPERCAPARVLVCNAEVNLVLRTVEQTVGHRRVALVDGVEEGIAELR